MKIIYFGSACDKEWFDKISQLKATPYSTAQYRFEMALLAGFASMDEIEMEIFYLHQEDYYPKGHFLIYKTKSKELNKRHVIKYLPGMNLPIIKEIFNLLLGIFLTFKWAIINRNEQNKIILTPFNYAPLSLGTLFIANIFGIKRVNVFTDLSSDIMNEKRQKDMIWIKQAILPCYKKLIGWIETNYDFYILFTDAMNERVNPKNKPYLVMEGIFNADLDLSEMEKEKAIMYAGTLSFEYGIKMFLDAFEKIPDENIQLWLFGDGDMGEYINKLCERDDRVIYYGFKSHEEVFEYEKKATLLINTRNPMDEYTRYSFPSKTFEYMVSGTPFLTTRIAGIPQGYYQYLYIIEEYSVESVKQKIQDVLAKPQSELDEFGKKARQFVLENKNSVVQTEKILDMLNHKLTNPEGSK